MIFSSIVKLITFLGLYKLKKPNIDKNYYKIRINEYLIRLGVCFTPLKFGHKSRKCVFSPKKS